MYDYVVMLLFDEKTSRRINELKVILRNHNVSNREKPWPPHITIDLYQHISLSKLIESVDRIVDNTKAFTVRLSELADFSKRVLFLRPDYHEAFYRIKSEADRVLGEYIIEKKHQQQAYTPHVTLVINDDIDFARHLLQKQFRGITGQISYLAIYSRQIELLKQYKLVKE